MALAGYGVCCFYPCDDLEVISPQPEGTSSAHCQGWWDGLVVPREMPQIWPHARGGTRSVPGECPHPCLNGDCSTGRGPGRACEKLLLFLLLLSPPPSNSRDECKESLRELGHTPLWHLV